MPRNQVEANLAERGIQVDRDTIKNYRKLFRKRAEKYTGQSFLGTNLIINVLKIFTGAENVEQLQEKLPKKGALSKGNVDLYLLNPIPRQKCPLGLPLFPCPFFL